MHATIDVRFEFSIDDDKTVPLAALSEQLTEQNIEATILEQLVASLDEQLVEALCGEKHARGNSDERFQRRGTKQRSAVTTAGEHDFDLHYVEDTAADTDEDAYFRPIEDTISFDGQRQYQQDIAFESVDLATNLSYRDAADHGDGILSMPSRSTINRRVKEYGSKLGDFLNSQLTGTNADTVLADGTKCHSQDDATVYNDIHVTLSQDEDDATSLLDVSVDDAWDDTATALDEIEAVTDDSRVVSDAEEGLTEAFTAEDRCHQLDLIHVPRTTSCKLWEDGAFSLDERNQIVSEVTNDLFHLKNSVEKHRPNEEWAAIRERIATTKQRIRHLAWQLDQLSSPKTATYLRRWLPLMVLFAEEAVNGFEVHGTSNPVERAMGEVSKRCKNQWMRWTADGLEAMLQLRLVDYANPEKYQAFKHDLLQRSTKTESTASSQWRLPEANFRRLWDATQKSASRATSTSIHCNTRTTQYGEEGGEIIDTIIAPNLEKSTDELRVGVMYENDVFGTATEEIVQEQASNYGYKVVESIGYPPFQTSDLSSSIEGLKQANVDVLYHSGYNADTNLLWQQAADLNLYVPAVVGNGTAYVVRSFIEAVGKQTALGIVNVDQPHYNVSSDFAPGMEKILKAYRDRYDETPVTQLPATTYSCTQMFKEVASQANSFGLDDFEKAALSVSQEQGSMANGWGLNFDEEFHRDQNVSVAGTQWQPDEFTKDLYHPENNPDQLDPYGVYPDNAAVGYTDITNIPRPDYTK